MAGGARGARSWQRISILAFRFGGGAEVAGYRGRKGGITVMTGGVRGANGGRLPRKEGMPGKRMVQTPFHCGGGGEERPSKDGARGWRSPHDVLPSLEQPSGDGARGWRCGRGRTFHARGWRCAGRRGRRERGRERERATAGRTVHQNVCVRLHYRLIE